MGKNYAERSCVKNDEYLSFDLSDFFFKEYLRFIWFFEEFTFYLSSYGRVRMKAMI